MRCRLLAPLKFGTLVGVVAVVLVFGAAGADPARASFPGANGKIAFYSFGPGTFDIFVMNPDGSDRTNLTSGFGPVHEGVPAWSPDGTNIAFVAAAGVLPTSPDIFLMTADGTVLQRLTNNPGLDTSPAWSPDGSKIAFSSDRDGNLEIYVMDADGSNQTNLTNNAASDGAPAWSPDGSTIAFRSDRDGNDEIYVMDVDGSNPTNLTNNAADDADPAWSPDGTKIAFASDRTGNSDVFAMSAGGTGQINLTNDSASDSSPAWSPDGLQIAYERDFGDPKMSEVEVFVMNADGSDQTNLTNNALPDYAPDWQPLTAPPPTPSTLVRIDPPSQTVTAPNAAVVDILVDNVDNAEGIGSFEITLEFDPNVLSFSDFSLGSFVLPPNSERNFFPLPVLFETAELDLDGDGVFSEPGLVRIGAVSIQPVPSAGPAGSGQLVTVTFATSCGSPGTSPVDFVAVVLADPSASPDGIPARSQGGSVTVDDAGESCATPTPTPTATPTPTNLPVPPTPIGGIGIFPLAAGTPLEAEGSSRIRATAVAGVVAALAAGAVALGGAAWYAKRRWSR